MGRPPDTHEKLSSTLAISEYKAGGDKGFWLYDTTRGMNLAMRAETEREAFLDALEYYRYRLLTVEQELSDLRSKVNHFLSQFNEEYYIE